MADFSSEYLVSLADKYEVPSFYNEDPSQFLRWYSKDKAADVECASFIAAMLAFGSRKQFIPKITAILQTADKTSGSITAWLKSGAPNFNHCEKKFYRFYSYDDMHLLFSELAEILKTNNTLGSYFECQWKNNPSQPLDMIISNSFPKSKIVSKGKTSANKRIHMFLRWMVRQNSCIDLGLWNWYPQTNLIIPLDVHVMEEGIKMGLLSPNATASRKTAILLTQKMSLVFPTDPARADFALFGLGVDSNSGE